ncbi:hypothetical protein [Pseudophaeobacter sp. C1-32P7]|uniref:hypothetical protein n=1 Tax=Pseudophaeobacter sp. C1-32P7 TaxID=3098142 RepID=UPI0034D4D9F7
MSILHDASPSASEDTQAWMDVTCVIRDLQRRLDQRQARRAGISVSYLRHCRREERQST